MKGERLVSRLVLRYMGDGCFRELERYFKNKTISKREIKQARLDFVMKKKKVQKAFLYLKPQCSVLS